MKDQRHANHLPEEDENHISRLLGTLAPGPLDQPHAPRALAEFKKTVERRDEIAMFEKIKTSKKAQRIIAVGLTVLVIAGLLALPPVRALASEFLALFRVEKFVIVSIDPERAQQIAEALNSGTLFGQEEVLVDPGEPVAVSTLEEAAALAGFTPLAAPDTGTPERIEVSGRGVMRFTPDAAALRDLFSSVGLDPTLLPDNIDGKPFDITVPAGVMQSYRNETTLSVYTVMQMPSPTVSVPEGVDIKALGEAMLQLLGMSPAEAERLSNTIDWTTTLVVPIPADMMSNVQEVDIRGTSGLLFWSESVDEKNEAALMWEEGGYVFLATGPGTGDVLAFAEGLR